MRIISDFTKANIMSTIKQYITDACIKLNASSTIADPNIELAHKERTNHITKLQFLDKESKKCLFPTLQFGSFKKTKIGNSTPKSITEEVDSFLQEDDISMCQEIDQDSQEYITWRPSFGTHVPRTS